VPNDSVLSVIVGWKKTNETATLRGALAQSASRKTKNKTRLTELSVARGAFEIQKALHALE
jgi:hypothetical protein